MTSTLDDRIRGAMCQLADAAPEPRPFEQLPLVRTNERQRGRTALGLSLGLALLAAVVIAIMMMAGSDRDTAVVTVDTPPSTVPGTSSSMPSEPSTAAVPSDATALYYVPGVVPGGWSLQTATAVEPTSSVTVSQIFADGPIGDEGTAFHQLTSVPGERDLRPEEWGLEVVEVHGVVGALTKYSAPDSRDVEISVEWAEAGRTFTLRSIGSTAERVVEVAESITVASSTAPSTSTEVESVWFGIGQDPSAVSTTFRFTRGELVLPSGANALIVTVNAWPKGNLSEVWRSGRLLADGARLYRLPFEGNEAAYLAALPEGIIVTVDGVPALRDDAVVAEIVQGLRAATPEEFEALPMEAAAMIEELPVTDKITIHPYTVEFRGDDLARGTCLATPDGYGCAVPTPLDPTTTFIEIADTGYWVGESDGRTRIDVSQMTAIPAVSVGDGRIVFVAERPADYGTSFARVADPRTGLDIGVCCGFMRRAG